LAQAAQSSPTQVSLLSVEADRDQLQENCSSVAKVNPWYSKKREY